MKQKEFMELRRQFKADNYKLTVNRVSSSLIGPENIVSFTSVRRFDSIPDIQKEVYFNMCKKILSGTTGKTLLDYEISNDKFADELSSVNSMISLIKNDMSNEDSLNSFIQLVADSAEEVSSYFIHILNCCYGVGAKSSDDMGDSFSDCESQYSFLIVIFSDAEHQSSKMFFDNENKSVDVMSFTDIFVKESPSSGFLYPAFNDGNADVSHIIYNVPSKSIPKDKLVSDVFNSDPLVAPKTQKLNFDEIVIDSIGKGISYEDVSRITTELSKEIHNDESSEDSVTPLEINKEKVLSILGSSLTDDAAKIRFNQKYDELVGESESILASSVVDADKLKIEMAGIKIDVKGSDAISIVSTKVVDGKKYIMIESPDTIVVNGFVVSAI